MYFFTIKSDKSATKWKTKMHAGRPHRNESTLVAVVHFVTTFDAAGPQAVVQVLM